MRVIMCPDGDDDDERLVPSMTLHQLVSHRWASSFQIASIAPYSGLFSLFRFAAVELFMSIKMCAGAYVMIDLNYEVFWAILYLLLSNWDLLLSKNNEKTEKEKEKSVD